MTNDQKINLIGQKILLLSNQIDLHKKELDALRRELEQLKAQQGSPVIAPVTPPVVEPVAEIKPVVVKEEPLAKQQATVEHVKPVQQELRSVAPGSNLEEKIGSKIFSIIGIIALVLGVSIGVKYAIDKDLINETGRLVLGYAAGIVLLDLSFFYKKRYGVFSAVLLSGAMAIMYFTTFLGYSYYHKYPAAVAFLVMAVFTAFTVFAAHVYNYEIIALIGLVGGYALPPLLSTGSGEIQYMFGFMLLLNLGVLALSFLKYWKFVNHVAYGLTWLIFASWMLVAYKAEVYFWRTICFSTAFYLLFYLSFIAYKLFRNKPFSAWDIVLVLSNSLIYFGVGYNALTVGHEVNYTRYQGLFCVFNALVHLVFAFVCSRRELADKSIFHVILAMVISFLTIAVPIQLDGNAVTLVWITEMLVLLWMWKRFHSRVYITLGSVLSLLAFFSLLNDWTIYYHHYTNIELVLPVIINRYALTGACVMLGYWFGWYLLRHKAEAPVPARGQGLAGATKVALLVMALLVTYFACQNEIGLYFHKQYTLSQARINGTYGYSYLSFDRSWNDYEVLWHLNFSAAFIVVVGLANMRWFKDKVTMYLAWSFTLLFLLLFLTVGLIALCDLRPDHQLVAGDASRVTGWNIYFRYVCLLFGGLMMWMLYRYRNHELLKPVSAVNTWLFHVGLLLLLSSELTNLMALTHPDNVAHYRKVSFRMGYTVLWGLYSMALITYGIIRQRKMLRIIAISLFGATILKLAADALSMTRGYQLIVFITIGVILLIVSFMYQKFKPLLFGKDVKPGQDGQDAV